jgi:hypothetical protein
MHFTVSIFDKLTYGDDRQQPDELTPEQIKASKEAARELGQYMTAMVEFDERQTNRLNYCDDYQQTATRPLHFKRNH